MFRRCYGELGMLWRLCRLLANADVVGTTFDFGSNGPQADYFAFAAVPSAIGDFADTAGLGFRLSRILTR